MIGTGENPHVTVQPIDELHLRGGAGSWNIVSDRDHKILGAEIWGEGLTKRISCSTSHDQKIGGIFSVRRRHMPSVAVPLHVHNAFPHYVHASIRGTFQHQTVQSESRKDC